MLLWKVFALVLVLVLSPVVFAADPLVKEMEAEIRIVALAEVTIKEAGDRVRAAVKKTSLWKQYEEAKEAYEVAEHRKQREFDAYAKAVKDGRSKDAERLRLNVDTFRSRKVQLTLREWQKIENQINDMVSKYARKVYLEEMTRKLKELKVEITKDILEKIKKSYKFQAA